MKSFLKNIHGDKTIWAVVVLLSILSLLSVYSSIVTLAYKYKSGDTTYYLLKHAMIILFGLFLMFLTHKVRSGYYSRFAIIAVIAAVPLLLLTLLTGSSINHANRWLEIPVVNLTFQTSDFAKLALIMYVARTLAVKQDVIKDFRSAFFPIVVPVLVVCGLILPANFSTAAILFLTSMILMFIGRIKIKYILSLMGVGVVFFGLFILFIFLFPHVNNRVATWKSRIENFSEGKSEGNYQVEQSKIAIATGGMFGKGPGKSTQRNFLPHPYSDFIYAIIIEEYGMVVGLIVIFLYLILLYRAVRIATKCQKIFPSMLAIGCSFSLVFQAMINMAVAVNLVPVTGQPLPLVSMGGTSIWFTSIAIGMVLSASRELEKERSPSRPSQREGVGEVSMETA
ncbi:MAG: FtsW/RodA/SpoVE family cell cycle protein [Bacteroidetes bacterium]|nr:FtsW/RodA/SpoVE family cell cycle protein [Bacteroidota bacterium]